MKTLILFGATAILMAGCVTRYPMGMNQEQWESLSPREQADYRAKQYEIDARSREQQRQHRLEMARLAQARAEAEAARVREMYRNARYGDILRVTVSGGILEYHGRRHAYHPIAFDIARGETKSVGVTEVGRISRTVHLDVRLSGDGNTLYWDDFGKDRIVIVNRDWETGQTFTIPPAKTGSSVRLSGATFFLKFKELQGAPRRIIIEHR